MAETYSQIRTWIDGIFKLNGKKFITGEHANMGYKKVLAKSEELFNSQAQPNGIATLGADGLLSENQRPASDSSYKGYFVTPAALNLAYPEGQTGWFCTVGSTDTIWTWDDATTAWVDTNKQSAGMATQIYEAATKATPADADLLGYVDTENSNVLKKFTWANLKAALKGYFDTLYKPASATDGGSAYLLTISENPTYYADGSVKILKQAYVSDPTKYYEQRFEYTTGLASKIEIKDDIANKWVRHTNIYNLGGQIQAPTITTITAWTII